MPIENEDVKTDESWHAEAVNTEFYQCSLARKASGRVERFEEKNKNLFA
ncbi:MAG: hypothetical protein R2825_02775 [Saprospiraceae bacterium]